MQFVAFPLLLLIFFALNLTFVSLIHMSLGKFLPGFILCGTLCLGDLGDCSGPVLSGCLPLALLHLGPGI